MEVYYNHIKALHLIFVITWFAGLFYISRIFVYHLEAQKKSELENKILSKQFKIMAKRLWYIITLPSSLLATFFALVLLFLNTSILLQDWMIIKLFFVIILFLYQWKTHKIFKELQIDYFRHSSTFIRLWNEVPTIILFAVVFLVILKRNYDWVLGVLGLIVVTLILFFGIKLYKKRRNKSN
ncbi:MAG: CopD family protein [Flavobacteriaceae bacterium]|nr:CopD family protein [Flavobacteriaceae bacterium]